MVDDTSIYGSAVIFAVYCTVAWSIVGINSVSFPISFVIVCAWLMTRIYVDDSLVWGSLRLAPKMGDITQVTLLTNVTRYLSNIVTVTSLILCNIITTSNEVTNHVSYPLSNA